jgi:prepilin-type N-terminal cleavage/methylation domain-containing protein
MIVRPMREPTEDGFTLIEISITLLLLSTVLAMILQSMVSVQNAVDRETGRSTRNDRLHLAVYALERQVRSGNVIGDPAVANDPGHGIYPGMSVRVFTQADASVGMSKCVEWRVYNSRLESRDWSPTWTLDGIYDTSWTIIADGIRNRDVSPNVVAFVKPASALYGLRMLKVTLLADGQGASGGGHERNLQRIETSITGRNTGYGYPANTCDSGPPYP